MANRFNFRGENRRENYFEGWFIKTNDKKNDLSVALIPGVAHFSEHESFVQYNIVYKDTYYSGKITFSRDEFDVVGDPQTVMMPKFVFNEKGIKASLNNGETELLIDFDFGLFLPIRQSLYTPSIMGPLEYLNMPCNHDIVSLRHTVKGRISINGEAIELSDALGYIEKDRGSTFPSRYAWAHANGFEHNSEATLFLSAAELEKGPLKKEGAIAIFHDGKEEHRFATYYGTVTDLTVSPDEESYTITMKDLFKKLKVTVSLKNGSEMIAPMNAGMDYPIKETVKSDITMTFTKKNGPTYHLKSTSGAGELVNW